MNANEFVLQLLAGLQIGSTYALLALGISLVIGTLGIVNLAQGVFFLLGVYLATLLSSAYGFFPALFLVPALLLLCGLVIERGLLRFVYQRTPTEQLLLVLGLALVVEQFLDWQLAGGAAPFPIPAWGAGMIRLDELLPFIDGYAVFPKWRIVMLVLALVIMLGLFMVLRHTASGRRLTADMHEPEVRRVRGVVASGYSAVVFGLGAALAGIAGVLAGPVTPLGPDTATSFLVPALIAVVIGGLGSLAGAVIGGLAIGLVLSFTSGFAALQPLMVYFFAFGVLLWRPRGLFERKGVVE